MSSNGTNGTRTSLSEIEYEEFLDNCIPATIFLIFLSVVGTIGNIHTILVYMLSPIISNYSVRVLIIWIASIDLTACIFGMPFENFVMRYNYTFASAGACKFFKFLSHISTGASTLLLTAIAIERYKIVVKNSPILITNSQRSNAISAFLLVLSVILSIPAVVFYGLNENKTKILGLSGMDCRILLEYQNIHNAGGYYSIVGSIGLVCVVVCIVSYGRILYEICTQKEWRKSLREKSNSSSISPSNIRSGVAQVTSSIQNEELQISELQTGCVDRTKKKSTNSSHNLGNAIQLTISLVIATAVSLIGYLVYVFTKMVDIMNPKIYKNIIQKVSNILLRGYFVNNAANSIVFCLFDRTFRQECLKLYGKIFVKKKISPA
ncbi:cholecystokinin B receptor [Mytilus galloprovincialis]|uniref:Cholecystokinin B receptor n=2 Tax=Mytilus galloprovincialis TaxID=29158 RepID=A0A8B6GFK7_MYTGA|nr:cholecystokinin B receptor [Mytilus galloprovincialis]